MESGYNKYFLKEKYILPLTQENLFYLNSNQIEVN